MMSDNSNMSTMKDQFEIQSSEPRGRISLTRRKWLLLGVSAAAAVSLWPWPVFASQGEILSDEDGAPLATEAGEALRG